VSASVICHGCGQRLDVPAGYQRRKMRCPHCGVICELPEPGKAAGPAPRPARRPAAPDLEAAAEEILLRPPAAGEGPDAEPEDRRRRSPPAGIKPAAERTGMRPARPGAAPPPPVEGEGLEGEDGYGVVGGLEEPKCSGCGKPLAPNVVVCAACGFNRQTGKKPPKVYEPLECRFEAGWPLQTRVLIFIAFEALVLPLGLACALMIDEVPGFVFCWLLGTAMAAFLLGTFDRVDLARNKRGRVTLTKTWRVCFVPRPTESIRVSEYEGIVSGQTRDVEFWDWLILFVLLPVGVVPAILWYCYAINRNSFQVALAKDHGYPDVILYRGWSEDHMRHVARTLSEATGMPWDGA
jgi:hypothetical protein